MKGRQRRPNRHPGGAARTRARSTMLDVARAAGVSTATISRFFNQPEKLSPKTWSRVQSAINLHHYVADGQAGGLASRRSRTLGLIIPTITNSIYAASTQAIQQTAQREGYTVLVGVSEFSPRQEATLVHRLLERRVEGLILTGAERNPELYEKISRNHVPFVVTWKSTRGTDLPSISFDNYKAARGAVDHLVALGHRRIGMICGRTEVNDRAFDRRRAFEDTLATYGLEVDPALIFERSFEFRRGTSGHACHAGMPPPTDGRFLRQRYPGNRCVVRVPRRWHWHSARHVDCRLRRPSYRKLHYTAVDDHPACQPTRWAYALPAPSSVPSNKAPMSRPASFPPI